MLFLKKILKKILPLKVRLLVAPYRRQHKNFKTLASLYGQFKSMKLWDARDSSGECIPWLTYPAIEYLNQFDFSKESVLEFGSGNSTIWWSKRTKNVVCIEDNQEWYEKVKERLSNLENTLCFFESDKLNYANSKYIEQSTIIIVDGNHRGECVKSIVSRKDAVDLSCKMIIVDNSDWLPGVLDFLSENLNWVQVDFMGFAPINGYCHATTIFINPKNRIPRISTVSPIGGVEQRFSFDLT